MAHPSVGDWAATGSAVFAAVAARAAQAPTCWLLLGVELHDERLLAPVALDPASLHPPAALARFRRSRVRRA
jgi:hypothetical protein